MWALELGRRAVRVADAMMDSPGVWGSGLHSRRWSRAVAGDFVEGDAAILVSSRKRVRRLAEWLLPSAVQVSVLSSDYKFLARTGRTVSSTRPSTQICDSLNSPTQLPPPKLAQIEPFLF